MTTTIRSSRNGLDQETYSYGGVDLLERRGGAVPSVQPETDETESQTRERMRMNLERLMNFGKEETVDSAADTAIAETASEEAIDTATVNDEVVNVSDDDIRPTSTTMQFGNDGKETVFKDMAKQKEEESAYKLNGKGKAVVILYAIAVVVVLALIILNTGVLSVLSRMNSAKAETLIEKQGEVAALYQEIDEVSSDEYVIRLAEEELHMVRG